MTEQYMTTAQVARFLNVHPDTVRRYRKRGLLQVVSLPVTGKRPALIRFRKSDVEALLEPQEESNNGNLEVETETP